MNCPEFQELTPRERTEYIGKLLHAAMSDSKLFERGHLIIDAAEKKGLFTNVKINPPTNSPEIIEP